MGKAFSGVVLLAGIAGMVLAFRRARIRRLALDRLREPHPAGGGATGTQTLEDAALQVFAQRHYVLPWLFAGLIFAGLGWIVSLPLAFAGALAGIAGLLAMQTDATWLAWRHDRIENQLADAIDLMVAAVKVGSSIQNALEYAAADAPAPLGPQLEDVVGRIRYGDN